MFDSLRNSCEVSGVMTSNPNQSTVERVGDQVRVTLYLTPRQALSLRGVLTDFYSEEPDYLGDSYEVACALLEVATPMIERIYRLPSEVAED